MNLEELLKGVNLKQEQLHPAEATTLITLLEYDAEAAKAIAAKIKGKVIAREQKEVFRKEVMNSFKEWLEKMNNGEHKIASLSFRAPDEIFVRFSNDPTPSSSPRSRRPRSRSASSTNELLEKIEALGYSVNVVEEQTRGGNIIKKYAVKLLDGSVLKDQWLQRLYERLTKVEEGTRNEAQAEEE